MRSSQLSFCGLLAVASAANCTQKLRSVVYFDQYHTTTLPSKNVTAGITHVVMAFANSSLFIGDTQGEYSPFMEVDQVRSMFDQDAQVGIAIGGWGDTTGFGEGAKDEASRATYATNVAAMLDSRGFDFIDVDWEYPGGNGADYKQIPNSDKVDEITTFPLLLGAIKSAIGDKELSIATPGLEKDMIAYTPEHAQQIWDAVDFVNIMTYDLITRRDNATKHHSDVQGSLAAVDKYLSLGLPASKINLGLAFYAKYFQTQPGVNCTEIGPVGCPLVKAENDDGSDAGTSGALTFETANVSPTVPTNLTTSSDGSCGVGTFSSCQNYKEGDCCSSSGYCGSTSAHCGTGCQSAYGTCTGPSVTDSFLDALEYGVTDEAAGGQWWWDEEAEIFWTWDTAALIQQKFSDIVAARGLGGIMAWSLGEDSYDWSHLNAMVQGAKSLSR